MFKPANLRRNFVSRLYLAPMSKRHLCMEGDPGAGGGGAAGGAGGAGGTTPPTDPLATLPEATRAAVQAAIEARVATEVTGLKAKNGELIQTQKTLKDSLAKFEGIEPDAVREILKRFADDEEAGLIKAGKIDEVLNKRTERMSKDWEKKVQAEAQRADKMKAKADKLAERAMGESVLKAATKSGALPEAQEDIILRAKGAGWTVNDDGDTVCVDRDGNVVIGKDGKTPLTPDEWAAGLRETAPHLWPRAQGSGANGSNHAAHNGMDLSKLSPEARMTYARTNGAGGAPAR